MHPTAAGGGAIIAGQAARGFGSAMFQALRHGVMAAPPPQVTVQVPSTALNAASTAAVMAVAAELGAEVKALVQAVAPYCRYGFYTFMILVGVVILEKVHNGPLGALVRTAAKALVALGRAGAPHAKTGIVRFVKVAARLLRALYSLPASTYRSIIDRVVAIQNYVGHKVATVHAAVVATKNYVMSTKNAVIATATRTLARVRAAGTRVRTAVGGVRARMAARRKARNNRAIMERNAKIRANLSDINKRVTANEEARIQGLINKVKRTSQPLTAKEKREYLAIVRKTERQARKNVTMANANAAQALVNLGRRRSH